MAKKGKVGASHKEITAEAQALDPGLELTANDFKVLQSMTADRRQRVMQNILQRQNVHGLKPGEVQAPLPPNPPPNHGRMKEVGRGGALSKSQKDIGPELDTPEVLRDQEVHREREQPEVAISTPTGTVLRLPDFSTCDISEGEEAIAMARKLLEDAGKALAARIGQEGEEHGYKCAQCGAIITRAENAKMIRARRIPETNNFVNDMWCSIRCYTGMANASAQADRRPQSLADMMAVQRGQQQ